ncbi:hypothetical protein, partial [Neisseria sicca]|uniref:hypothetical protein n=1 Tax=Neisseria sicca TaxID=490 RepID=UPI000367B61E
GRLKTFQTTFTSFKSERKQHEKIRKPVKQIVIGTYQSMRAAAQQVDLLMKGNGDLCVNIVQEGRKFQVRTVVWQ